MIRKIGGWLEKSRRIVYENNWIRVSHSEVVTPGGSDGIYGVVHFKSTAVGVVPVDDEGYTWLVRQSRYPLQEYTWEIPEGGAPRGEDPLAAGKRELLEEVGLTAADWQPLLRMHLSNSVCDEAAIVYLAQGLSLGATAHEDTEDIEILRLPLMDAVAMVLQGEITDAISVAALLKLALRLRELLPAASGLGE